ncbi:MULTISPECIES: NAD(P)/FAD-dependent oxidoreductase [Ramlibacter]|uniref:FAD-dependent oxidoreductase n=1 Tax=Ramlibacter pinisoli TaxID=2682844 RepID=A0A6N8ITS3_9BURK|nr:MULTISPECIES: FAD-dependent oxidoreductase [Ramlibacter]MBA2965395.1 FAD-dependent oxidoreductase [Ramlibacter sp. CGMCC 1.13660]MVQ30359.1 FAD-dependent oxidoreductase [Ramlibacter pinisoli]
MHLVVLGTGIVGTCTGAWLQRDGHQVTFVSPVPPGEACSFGNAGSLSPSACLPVGMPGMWKQVPGWLRDPDGPLAIRPSYLPTVLPWLLRFLRHSSRAEVVRIAGALRGLLAPIFDSYAPLLERAGATALVRRSGCLYVYGSSASARRWQWGMDLRRRLGVDLRDVGEQELAQLEPDLRGRFRFGILAPDNGSTLDPEALVKALHRQCIADGARLVQEAAAGFEQHGDRVRGVRLASGQRIECDGVVVAAGAWSRPLAQALGLRIPLETQRGYHVTVQSSNLGLRHTVMAPEYNLMVNPMAMGLRLAGSVEFAGLRPPPNERRADVLLAKGREMFPHLDSSRYTRWMGHRPCLPDSLPVIGRAPRLANAWLAFGHGHVGMCAGASTGREVAHLVAGRTPQVDLRPFAPDRF